MLSNAYFLAKFRFDTAENEPAKNLQNFPNFPNGSTPPSGIRQLAETVRCARGLAVEAVCCPHVPRLEGVMKTFVLRKTNRTFVLRKTKTYESKTDEAIRTSTWKWP